jgi:hypothetical protein
MKKVQKGRVRATGILTVLLILEILDDFSKFEPP